MPQLDAGLGDDQGLGIRQVALARLHVEQFVDHPRVDGGALHLHLKLGKAAGGIVSQEQRGDEGEEGAGRHVLIDRAVGGVGKNAGDGETGKAFGHRRVALRQPCDLVGAALGGDDDLVDLLLELALHREGLDDGDALDGLLHGAEHVAVEVDRFLGGLAQAFGKVAQRQKQRRRQDQDGEAQQRILVDHDAEQRHEGQEIAGGGGDRQVEDIADAADILADLGGDAGRARLVEIADRQRHQMHVETALVTGDDVVADLRQRHRLAIAGEAAHDEGDEDRQTDDPHDIGAPVGEGLVDDRAHDPGGEGRRQRDEDKTADGDDVAPDVLAAVFSDDALQNGGDRTAVNGSLLGIG